MARRYDSELNEGITSHIWQNIILHQNELLHTAKGLPFTYSIKMLSDGTLGNEIVVSRRSKTITRATVDKAYQKVIELGEVQGPKQLGVFGASYLYVIFKVIGVINGDGVHKENGVIREDGVIEDNGVINGDGVITGHNMQGRIKKIREYWLSILFWCQKRGNPCNYWV